MALLTAAELKASREAVEAGVSTVADGDANQAISDAQAFLERTLGYRIEVADVSISLRGAGTARLFPTERVRTVATITDEGSSVASGDYLLENDGWTLRMLEGGYWTTDGAVVITGTFGFTSSDDEWKLAKRAVLLLAVRQLQGNASTDNLPNAPSGAYLSSYASENATFTFDRTATGDGPTPYDDVNRIIDAIGPIKTYA